MLWPNHLLFSFVLFVLSLNFFNILFLRLENLIYLFVVLFFSVFPDFDSYNSKFGRKLKILKRFFKHRGILHSFFGMFFVMAVFYIVLLAINLPNNKQMVLFGFVGYGSHLIADSLTRGGCALFLPFSDKKLKGFIKTGSVLEYLFVSFLTVLTLLWIINNLWFRFLTI